MRRLPALIGKTFWPLAFAQRTFCAAEIRARAAADIFRRGLDDPVLYVPAKAASAAFSPFNCRATLSLSAFISAIMSMCSPRARIVANNNRRLRGSLHQLEEHAQCLVKLATFRCAEALALLYSVLMNCVTRRFYSFRKSSEIKFENGSVVQLLPRGVGHSGLPAGVTRKRGVPGYCASAKITIARSRTSISERSCGRIIRHETLIRKSAAWKFLWRKCSRGCRINSLQAGPAPRATGRFRFLRFSAILRQRRLTTDSPRPSFKDMIVLHTSPSRPSIPKASSPVPKG